MVKKIILLLVLCVTVYSQDPFDFFAVDTRYTPVVSIDTGTYPLTPYGNGYVSFNGQANKQFMRAMDINFTEFIYGVTDSFTIECRIKIKIRKAMWLMGKHNGSAGSWILGFNSNSGNTLEFYLNGWKSIKVLATNDSLWQTVLIKFRKSDNELNIWRNDTLLSTTTSFSYTSGNNTNAFVVGHATMPASISDPTTGNGSPGTHFSSMDLDYLYIHKYYNGGDSALIYNFNEGAGQNVYDSLDYLNIDRASPDATVRSFHLCSGWSPGLDSQDITWFKGTTKSLYTNNTTVLGSGLWGWQSAISSFGQTFTNGMTVWNDKLVPTTAFNRVNVTHGTWTHNGDTAADIAQWDGATWSKIGSNGSLFGTGGSITQAFDYFDTLVVGGSFTNIQGANGDYVLRYTGAVWDTMSKGFDNAVYSFTIFNGKLLAGGAFNNSGATSITSSVAQWNPTTQTWSAIGTSNIGEVWSLEVHNSELYAGTPSGLWKFNGTDWTQLSTLSSATVYCLQSFNNQLWYGGTGGTLGYWNGTTNSMGTVSGFANHIIEFCTDGTDLYVTGSFYRIIYNGTNTVVNKLARWNKREWSALGYGADERPEDLTIYNGKLAFTGDFYVVNGVAHNNITTLTIP